MIRKNVPVEPKYPTGAPITDDPVLFVLKPGEYTFFHDRIRGVAFERGPKDQPLDHRYMVIVQRAVAEMKMPGRQLAALKLPKRYRP